VFDVVSFSLEVFVWDTRQVDDLLVLLIALFL